MLSLEVSWSIPIGKLLTLSGQRFVDCDKVDSACTVSSTRGHRVCVRLEECVVHRRQSQFWNPGYVLGFDLRSLKEVVTEFVDATVNSWIFSSLGKVTRVRHFLFFW